MIHHKVVIVGGGPAGAACAGRLVQAGRDPLVVDKQIFPRQKLCAGWLTPEVFKSLGVLPQDYPADLTAFPYLRVHLNGIPFRRRGMQYAIRRLEFDHWLLERSGASVIHHEVKDIQPNDGGYCLDGLIQAEILIGAGGTHCPVYRRFYAEKFPRNGARIITLEDELKQDRRDPVCRLWFFENRLPGYAWYVPKKGGYVNIGVGGNLASLKQRGLTIQEQWDYFLEKISRMDLVGDVDLDPNGYIYHLRGDDPVVVADTLYITGDAAGLATLDMGEGIGPAIQSGLLVAEAILNRSSCSFDSVSKYSLLPGWLQWLARD